MRVEACSLAVLGRLLPRLDRRRRGLCIDVGVGTFAFFCEHFARLGFATTAVEPLPVAQLRRICSSLSINLIEGCLSDHDGVETLHIGSFEGVENLNLSSIEPQWWGTSANSQVVPAMTLGTLLVRSPVTRVTCLKLDIEGAEARVIRQLRTLPSSLLPLVVVFEYGGGAHRGDGRGGWSVEFLKPTLESIEILSGLGYRWGVILDSASGTGERVVTLDPRVATTAEMFDPNAEYGNLIVSRAGHIDEGELSRICGAYRTDKAGVGLPTVRFGHSRRLLGWLSRALP